MYQGLRDKVEHIAEQYADLVDLRIRHAKESELEDATVSTEILEAIRMLSHIAATLERVDRLHHNNSVDTIQ